MNHPESERNYIEELKAFLLFLKDLWGLLAGMSVLFASARTKVGLQAHP